jgi:hypothetical protein
MVIFYEEIQSKKRKANKKGEWGREWGKENTSDTLPRWYQLCKRYSQCSRGALSKMTEGEREMICHLFPLLVFRRETESVWDVRRIHDSQEAELSIKQVAIAEKVRWSWENLVDLQHRLTRGQHEAFLRKWHCSWNLKNKWMTRKKYYLG